MDELQKIEQLFKERKIYPSNICN